MGKDNQATELLNRNWALGSTFCLLPIEGENLEGIQYQAFSVLRVKLFVDAQLGTWQSGITGTVCPSPNMGDSWSCLSCIGAEEPPVSVHEDWFHRFYVRSVVDTNPKFVNPTD